MQNIKIWLKKYIIPDGLMKTLRPFYHGAMSLLGSWYYGQPSSKLVVIGVTGTNGKSTTVNLIAKILEEAGYKVGYTSTVTLKIGREEILNKHKMTMVSGWLLQKWMGKMVEAGCRYAVLEISSEGLAQNRHLGIDFDAAVFTNLTPEHLESHGGFENYKLAKSLLFASLEKHQVRSKKQGSKTAIVFNADDQYGKYYGNFKTDKCVSYGVKDLSADVVASNIQYSPAGVSYNLRSEIINLKLKGQFDVYNSLAAIAAAQSQNISLEVCKAALEKVVVVPGRVEIVVEKPFTVVVDYAYEPEEMRQLYETVSRWPHKKIIQVLGPTGGGRDHDRIRILGEMAGKFADAVWITVDDPYDDDPEILAGPMVEAAQEAGKLPGENLFMLFDRKLAIGTAMRYAQAGDLVLVTGKGADQKMALADGKYIDWDDRRVVKEEMGEMVESKLV